MYVNKVVGTLFISIQKGFNKGCGLLLLFIVVVVREVGKVELSVSFREGNKWVFYRSLSQGGEGNKVKGVRMVRIFRILS